MMHLTDTPLWAVACKSSVVVPGNAQSHVLRTAAASQAAAQAADTTQRVMAHGVQPETHSGAQQTGAYSEAYLPSRLSQETNGHSQGLTHPRYSPIQVLGFWAKLSAIEPIMLSMRGWT